MDLNMGEHQDPDWYTFTTTTDGFVVAMRRQSEVMDR